MWKNRYGFVCALIALLVGSSLMMEAQSPDPSTLPLIQFADLSYIGAFRTPRGFTNGDSFAHGGSPIAFNPGRNSLYVGSRSGRVAEISIPALTSTSDINQLQFAAYLQAFYEPTEGTISQVPADASLTGLLVSGNRLIGTAATYYDALNQQRVSHYSRSLVLSSTSTIGMRQVWEDARSGFVSGYMSAVPAEWQQRLGGPAATGQCCIPIAYRTSWGPSAFAFNPGEVATLGKVPAQPLLYYSDAHPTLGPWQGNGSIYSASAQVTGMAILAGTRTVLYFGRIGTGEFCYGEGTADISKHMQPTTGGETYCYDPTNTDKGQHGYPYHYQIWAYDLNELAAVKAGTKQAWEVRPYGVWPFSLPYPAAMIRIGGVGYDASRQIIYISQLYADEDTFALRPVIHALKVGGGAAGAPMPPADTTPLPAVTVTNSSTPDGNRLTALALTANKTAPQPANTTITLTATPTGGTAPHQYKWLLHTGTQWVQLAGWTTSNTYNWTPTTANSQYRLGVWVRSAGNTADTAEFTQSMDFAIGNATGWTAPYEATKGVSIKADKAAPQPAGSMITWTATPSGGQAPHQYKWLVHNGLQWNVVSGWSTSSTFVWTPAIPNSQYRVGVWVRSAGGTTDAPEASFSTDFAINGTATSEPAPPPPTTTSGGRLTALALSANKPAPQPSGTTITFTAVPTGGVSPHQFKFLIHDGLKWNEVTTWTTSNTYNWTPTVAGNQFRVGVWVRNAGVTADAPEFTQSMDYAVSQGTVATPAPAPSPTTSTRLLGVTLSANKIAPQPQNTTITFLATANGGTAPLQYKWLVHDGYQWKAVGDWSTSNTFNWTPIAWNSQYRFGVWVRNAGNTIDAGEVTNSMDFPIIAATTTTSPPPPTITTGGRITALSLTADKVAPQRAGTTITFTATPTGGAAPHQYKFLVHNGMSWVAVTGWSTSRTFSWTPAAANMSHRVGVWVRSNGATADAAEFTASIDFPISQ